MLIALCTASNSWSQPSTPNTDRPTSPALTTESPPDGQPTPVDLAGMAWIPGGDFTMGWDGPEGRYDERPAHRGHVDGF